MSRYLAPLVACCLAVVTHVSAQSPSSAGAPVVPLDPLPVPPLQQAEPAVLSADPSPSAPNPYAGGLLDRQYLSGDWGGWRSRLADRGVTMDLFGTQFYQGVARGGLAREWEYGGRLDYLLNVDGHKLGLWQGLFANMHVDTRFGTDTNAIDGALLPSNVSMSFPPVGTQPGTWITGLKLTQALSEHFLVYGGKVNTLEAYALKFSPGVDSNLPGLGGFQNAALVFNPIAARGVPYSAAAVGAVALFGQGSSLAFSVMDPEERTDRGLDNLFRTGVTMSTDLVLRGKPLGLPGILNLGGVYTTARFTSLDPSVYLNLARLGQLQSAIGTGNLPTEKGSWALYACGSQAIWQSPSDEKATWNVFGGVGLADGNPNPIRFYAGGGVGGRSLLPGRQLDSCGVGYFYLGLSDQFKSLARNVVPFRDEYGVELFYNIAVTRWCRLTPNLQVVRPSAGNVDTAILTGLRMQWIF